MCSSTEHMHILFLVYCPHLLLIHILEYIYWLPVLYEVGKLAEVIKIII